MKKKSTDPKLTIEAQKFILKWSTWFILQNQKKELKDAMEKELLSIMKECFFWGRISTAKKTSDKSMEFTFEEWLKTNSKE